MNELRVVCSHSTPAGRGVCDDVDPCVSTPPAAGDKGFAFVCM
jgi:hypothetical protein